MLAAGIHQACCGSWYFHPCAQRFLQLWAMRKKTTVQHIQEHLVCFHTSWWRAVGMLHLNSLWIRYLLWFIAVNMVSALIVAGKALMGYIPAPVIPLQAGHCGWWIPHRKEGKGRACPRAFVFLRQGGAWACACLPAPFAQEGISRACLPPWAWKRACARGGGVTVTAADAAAGWPKTKFS